MAAEINLHPQDFVDVFYDHITSFEDCLVEIAKDEEKKTFIYLTGREGFPYIIVKVNGEVKEETEIIGFNEADTLNECYKTYLGADCMGSEGEEDSTEQEIDRREEELMTAWESFLRVALDENFDSSFCEGNTSDIESSMDDVLTMLGYDYQWFVYRPMFIQNEDGTEEYEEYPYN